MSLGGVGGAREYALPPAGGATRARERSHWSFWSHWGGLVICYLSAGGASRARGRGGGRAGAGRGAHQHGEVTPIIVMIRWTGLVLWQFESPFQGSLTSTVLACMFFSGAH